MAYVKNIWVDQDVERPKTYEVTNNQDGSITLTDSFGLVTELGTPVNEVNMNHIEDGIDGCAIRKHNLTETFNLGEWVLGGTGDDEGIYKSLVASNVGNAITDDTKWEKVEMGGNSRNIGEIVTSTIPLIDAGLHLFDGALLTYGSCQAFIDYIADLYDSGDYPTLFDTEANWQASVTQYGACDKYVYDSVNNTVRIPKRNSEHGDLIKSYKSGTDWYRIYSDGWCEQGGQITKSTSTTDYAIALIKNYTSTSYVVQITDAWDSSTSGVYPLTNIKSKTTSTFTVRLQNLVSSTGATWYACGYIDISDYQYSPVYEYLVIATSTKTQIQVDIDEIATDLNNKMDKDGTNAVSSVKFADGQWVKSELRLAYDVTSPKTANINYDLSSYLPNDNYSYEVLFVSTAETGTTSNSQSLVSLSSQYFDNAYISRAHTKTASLVRGSGCAVLPIGSNHIITVNAWSDNTGSFSLYALAYRRVGTNQ